MYSLIVKSVKTETHVETASQFINVSVDLVEGETVVERVLGFDATLYTREQIKEELKKYLDTFNAEQAHKVVQAAQDEIDAKVAETTKELEGLTISQE
jgi:hypothetical protein